MVVKALSWALRALAVRDEKAATDFMRQEGLDSARVRREVTNRLKTGLRSPTQKRSSTR